MLERFLKSGDLKPLGYEIVGDVGMESCNIGMEVFKRKKLVRKRWW
jgi:hypothetical protein